MATGAGVEVEAEGKEVGREVGARVFGEGVTGLVKMRRVACREAAEGWKLGWEGCAAEGGGEDRPLSRLQ